MHNEESHVCFVDRVLNLSQWLESDSKQHMLSTEHSLKPLLALTTARVVKRIVCTICNNTPKIIDNTHSPDNNSAQTSTAYTPEAFPSRRHSAIPCTPQQCPTNIKTETITAITRWLRQTTQDR